MWSCHSESRKRVPLQNRVVPALQPGALSGLRLVPSYSWGGFDKNVSNERVRSDSSQLCFRCYYYHKSGKSC